MVLFKNTTNLFRTETSFSELPAGEAKNLVETCFYS